MDEQKYLTTERCQNANLGPSPSSSIHLLRRLDDLGSVGSVGEDSTQRNAVSNNDVGPGVTTNSSVGMQPSSTAGRLLCI